jgi:hypothetical protein
MDVQTNSTCTVRFSPQAKSKDTAATYKEVMGGPDELESAPGVDRVEAWV